jgi:hypothetical protein
MFSFFIQKKATPKKKLNKRLLTAKKSEAAKQRSTKVLFNLKKNE